MTDHLVEAVEKRTFQNIVSQFEAFSVCMHVHLTSKCASAVFVKVYMTPNLLLFDTCV